MKRAENNIWYENNKIKLDIMLNEDGSLKSIKVYAKTDRGDKLRYEYNEED